MFLSLGLWWLIYANLGRASKYLTVEIFGLSLGSPLGKAVEFFIYDGPKVLLLLSLVVFSMTVVRSYFSPEKTRRVLSGRHAGIGNVLGALFGIVTPFCTCSAVSLFIGFVTAGVPMGATFSFLVSAPMVNEIALILLYDMLGWKVAGLYLAFGLGIAMLSGFIIGKLKLERYIEDWVRNINVQEAQADLRELSFSDRIAAGFEGVRDIVGRVWHWILAGIAVGAAIHGYVPENYMAEVMGKGAWWSVPLAVLVGIPLYSNAAGVMPIVQALLGKGAAVGTVLAFMMSVIALSLPEMIILRRVLKLPMIFIFIGIVAAGILLVGYLFNAIL